MNFSSTLAACLVLPLLLARADGPADNLAEKVRPIPPPGLTLSPADRQELEKEAEKFGQELASLRQIVAGKPSLKEYLPDVEIFHKAVDWALRYNEFFKTNEIEAARQLLKAGNQRAGELKRGEVSWLASTGLVVRGYRSRIDDSVQPYGLVVPPSYQHGGEPKRLDFWFHGRGEQLSELAFMADRLRNPGEFAPPNTIVLHTYGRYCNGQRFAGETDAFEALEHVKKNYPIDENRILVRGFSLGGAACWHLAVHHASRWAAAAPGAGFSETADFLKVFQNEKLTPAPWEQKLWRWYDAAEHAVNLFNIPVVAYSGEIDRQKQAADQMAAAMKPLGLELTHLIGPQTAHKYHPETRAEINRRIDQIARIGRDQVPARVRFVTFTLKNNQMAWVELEGLEKHWERAEVEAEVASSTSIHLKTTNVTALSLSFPAGQNRLSAGGKTEVQIDGQKLSTAGPMSDRSWRARLQKSGSRWRWEPTAATNQLQKVPGLQGPIDDAFMERFLFVAPSGTAAHPQVQKWVEAEMARAVKEWRRQFRGDVRMKKDNEVTPQDIAESHLVVWGDPAGNQLLARVVSKLPIGWGTDVEVAGRKFSAEDHLPVLIYPNPLNPKRYLVLNSGFTFREYDYLNNARQTPKLPDYAVIDLKTPPNSRWAGKVVMADFFDENWK